MSEPWMKAETVGDCVRIFFRENCSDNDGSGAMIDCDELGGVVINWYLARMAKCDWVEE